MKRKKRNKKIFAFADHPLLFAHRGCSKVAPENTISSFKKVLENRIPGVELDVQMCKSGEIVVFHDLNLKRITGFDALVTKTELQEIKKLDAGSGFDESFSKEKIPTIDEVFTLMGTKVYYDIEIKHSHKQPGELEKKLIEKIYKWNLQDRVIISSFNPVAILGIRKIDPKLHTAIIYHSKKKLPWWLRNGGGKYICKPNILKPSKHKINLLTMFLHNKILGYNVITWTEDDPAMVKKYLNFGVDGIVTNVPENMIAQFSTRWKGELTMGFDVLQN
jgi:glycerophosphoryl diester phosphodiesterase